MAHRGVGKIRLTGGPQLGLHSRAVQRGLEPLYDWVGSWKGTGQPKRMSSKGAWTEEADWAWKLDKESASLEIKVKDGKLPGGESRTHIGNREERPSWCS